LSPLHRRIVVVTWVAFAVGVLALLLEQYVLALVVGVPAAVSLIALAWLTIRRCRRLLEEAVRKRQVESRGSIDPATSSERRSGARSFAGLLDRLRGGPDLRAVLVGMLREDGR